MADQYSSTDDILRELRQWDAASTRLPTASPIMPTGTPGSALQFMPDPFALPAVPAAPAEPRGATIGGIAQDPFGGQAALTALRQAEAANLRDERRTAADEKKTLPDTVDSLVADRFSAFAADPARNEKWKQLPWEEKSAQAKAWVDANVKELKTRVEATLGRRIKDNDQYLQQARKEWEASTKELVGARPKEESNLALGAWTSAKGIAGWWLARYGTLEAVRAAGLDIAAQAQKEWDTGKSAWTDNEEKKLALKRQQLEAEAKARGETELGPWDQTKMAYETAKAAPGLFLARQLPGMLPGTLAQIGVTAAGSLLSGGAGAPLAVVAGRVAGAAVNAVMTGADVASSAADLVDNASDQQLAANPIFQDLLAKNNGDMARAKTAMKLHIIDNLGATPELIGAVGGLLDPTGGAVGKALSKSALAAKFGLQGAAKGVGLNVIKEAAEQTAGVGLKATAKKAGGLLLKEGGSEYGEEFAGQVAANVAGQRGGLDVGTTSGAYEAGAAGAIGGMGMATGVSAGGKIGGKLLGPVTSDSDYVVNVDPANTNKMSVAKSRKTAEQANLAVMPGTGLLRVLDATADDREVTADQAAQAAFQNNYRVLQALATVDSKPPAAADLISRTGAQMMFGPGFSGDEQVTLRDGNGNAVPVTFRVSGEGKVDFVDPGTLPAEIVQAARKTEAEANEGLSRIAPALTTFFGRTQGVVSTQQMPATTPPAGTPPAGTPPAAPAVSMQQPAAPAAPQPAAQPAAPVVSVPQQPTTMAAPGSVQPVMPQGAVGFTAPPTVPAQEPDMPASVGQWFDYGGVQGQLVKRKSGYYIVPADRPQDAVFVEGGESGRLPAALGLTRYAQQPNAAAVAAGRATQAPTQLPAVAAAVSAANAPTSLDDRFNAAIDGLVELLGQDVAANVLESLTAPGQNFETLTKRIEARYYELLDAATSPAGQAAPVQPNGNAAPNAAAAEAAGATASAAETAPTVTQEPSQEELDAELQRQQQEAMAVFDTAVAAGIPEFRTPEGTVKPKPLAGTRLQEVVDALLNAISLGMPHSLIARLTGVGDTRRRANAMVLVEENWLALGAGWNSNGRTQDDKRGAMIHEFGHMADGARVNIVSAKPQWDAAHNELAAWYAQDNNTILAYPFGRRGISATQMRRESFAQAFRLYFTNNAALLQNAPAAHRAIAEVVTELRNQENDRARISARDRKNAAGAGTTVPATAATGVGSTQRAGDAGAGGRGQVELDQTGAAGRPAAQDLIDVDGVQRPRSNSTGRPIAGTDDAIRNFWRGFGDSKVVDAEGKPLVVYHGTPYGGFSSFDPAKLGTRDTFESARAGFYFSKGTQYAGMLSRSGNETGPAIYPVYLSIQNPLRVFTTELTEPSEVDEMIAAAKAGVHDGIIDEMGNFVAFRPEQIKSATGNIGTFSPVNARIDEDQTAPQPRTGASLLRQPAATAQTGPRAPGATLAALQGGQPAAAAGNFRGVTQALTGSGTLAQRYAKAKPYIVQMGDKLTEAFADALLPMVRWTQALPVPPVLKQAILGAMYRAPNIRDRVLERAYSEFGGDQATQAIADMVSRLRQRDPNATAESVTRDAGYWITARYALVKNQRMLDAAEDAMLEAELQLQTAKAAMLLPALPLQQVLASAEAAVRGAQSALDNARNQRQSAANIAAARSLLDSAKNYLARVEEIAGLQQAYDAAKAEFEDRQHALTQPETVNWHAGLQRPGVMGPPAPVGLAGGMNNAQADAFMRRAEQMFGRQALENLAKHIYRINAFRLATDLESGRTDVDTAIRFSPEIASTEQQMRNLVAVTANPQSSQRQIEAARKAFIDALTATGSTYVPTTGVPDAGFDGDVLGAGYKTPNVAREKRLGGRTTSLADDGITASFGGMQRSAAAAGWNQFSALIEDAYNSMTPEQRTAAGMKQVDITALQRLGDDVVIRNRPDGTAVGYSIGDGSELRALRRENVEEKSELMRILEKPTRWFATLATRWNLTFGPINMIRDVWERSENMRARSYTTASGNQVDSAKAARRMLAIARDPSIIKDIGAAYWAEARGKALPNNKYALYLREFEDLGGGGGKRGVSLARDRKTLAREIDSAMSNNRVLRSIKGINSYVNFWNDTFDSVAPLAAYMALREQGMSKQGAAEASLDLMNFRKTGAFMPVARMLYAFAQPTVTGGVNLVKTLKTKTGRQRFLAYTMAFIAWQAMAAMLGGDDEETGRPAFDALDDFAKERSLPLPLPGGGFFTIPLGFGLPLLANQTALFFRDAQDVNRGIEGATSELAWRYVKQVVPINDSKIEDDFAREFIQTFAPTALLPLANVAINRTGLGAEIIKEAFLDKDQYKSEQGSPMTAEDYKTAARIVRSTFGIDFAPEQIKELSNALTLGIFRDVRNVLVDNPWKEELGRPTKPPFIGGFYATTDNAILVDTAKFEREGTEVAKRLNANPDMQLSPREEAVAALYEEWQAADKSSRTKAAALTRAGVAKGAGESERMANRSERQAIQAEIIRRFNQLER